MVKPTVKDGEERNGATARPLALLDAPIRTVSSIMRWRSGKSYTRRDWLLFGLSAAILFVVMFPLLWMVLASLRPDPEMFQRPPPIIPDTWTAEHYIELFTFTSFPRYFLNSIFVALISCVGGLTIALAAVYSISRFRFVGARSFAFFVLSIYMLPPILLAIPLYMLWLRIDQTNSLFALAITYLTITVPFSLWILRPYIETIPVDLEEQAMVDGCTRFQAFRKVILPQARPGLIAVSVFTFVVVWNEYLYALLLITEEPKRTISLGIGSLILESSVYSWGLVNAAGVLAIVPILVLFVSLQRLIVSGMTAGALKG